MSASVFKIRRKSDGLFSSGGVHPKRSERGKAWATLGRAKQAVALLNDSFFKPSAAHYYKDCEIVELKLTEVSAVKIFGTQLRALYK